METGTNPKIASSSVEIAEEAKVPVPQHEMKGTEQCCNSQWGCFAAGFFLTLLWWVGAFMPLCSRPRFPTKCHRYVFLPCALNPYYCIKQRQAHAASVNLYRSKKNSVHQTSQTDPTDLTGPTAEPECSHMVSHGRISAEMYHLLSDAVSITIGNEVSQATGLEGSASMLLNAVASMDIYIYILYVPVLTPVLLAVATGTRCQSPFKTAITRQYGRLQLCPIKQSPSSVCRLTVFA